MQLLETQLLPFLPWLYSNNLSIMKQSYPRQNCWSTTVDLYCWPQGWFLTGNFCQAGGIAVDPLKVTYLFQHEDGVANAGWMLLVNWFCSLDALKGDVFFIEGWVNCCLLFKSCCCWPLTVLEKLSGEMEQTFTLRNLGQNGNAPTGVNYFLLFKS